MVEAHHRDVDLGVGRAEVVCFRRRVRRRSEAWLASRIHSRPFLSPSGRTVATRPAGAHAPAAAVNPPAGPSSPGRPRCRYGAAAARDADHHSSIPAAAANRMAFATEENPRRVRECAAVRLDPGDHAQVLEQPATGRRHQRAHLSQSTSCRSVSASTTSSMRSS